MAKSVCLSSLSRTIFSQVLLDDRRSYIPPGEFDPPFISNPSGAPIYVTKSVKIGETMRAAGLGRVIATGPKSKFKVGDVVTGLLGLSFRSTHFRVVLKIYGKAGPTMFCSMTSVWRKSSMFSPPMIRPVYLRFVVVSLRRLNCWISSVCSERQV